MKLEIEDIIFRGALSMIDILNSLFHRNQLSPARGRCISGVCFQRAYSTASMSIPPLFIILHLHLKQKNELLDTERMLGQTGNVSGGAQSPWSILRAHSS